MSRLRQDLRYGLAKYADEPRARVVEKALRHGAGRARSIWCLRQATSVGHGTISRGRVDIVNRGILEIGEYCRLEGHRVSVEIGVGPGARVTIGDAVGVNYGTTISATRSVTIGSRVLFGPFSTVLDSNFHGLVNRSIAEEPAPVQIDEDAWFGAFSMVMPGVTVGRAAMVAAHAVVTRDVEPFTVVAGVPARVVRRLRQRDFVPDWTPASVR